MRDQLLPLPSSRERLLPSTNLIRSDKARFERYSHRHDRPWTECILCDMRRSHLHVAPLFALPTTCGNSVSEITPPSLLVMFRTLPLCVGISIEYRNRNATMAPFSLSFPWHPFHLHHGDKCFIMLLSTFYKKLHKLGHVIRIMIITFKCLKIVLAPN